MKVIALDLDGTLLNSQKEISLKTKEMLIRLQEEGVAVLLSSGRPLHGMIRYAEELKINQYNGYISSYNGAKVTKIRDQKNLLSEPLDLTLAKDILRHLEKFDVKPMIFHENYVLVSDVYNGKILIDGQIVETYQNESRSNNMLLKEFTNLAEDIDFPPMKILISGNPEYLQENINEITQPFIGRSSMTFSDRFYFEFNALGVSKGQALKSLLERHDISPNQVVAFGDGDNDLTLIETAGLGVAMGNANEKVKGIADRVTLSNNEDGIAVFLEEILT